MNKLTVKHYVTPTDWHLFISSEWAQLHSPGDDKGVEMTPAEAIAMLSATASQWMLGE